MCCMSSKLCFQPDVLSDSSDREALVKRVNGLEKRLKDEAKAETDDNDDDDASDQTPLPRQEEIPAPVDRTPQIEQRGQPESSRIEHRQSRPSLERIGSNVPSFQ